MMIYVLVTGIMKVIKTILILHVCIIFSSLTHEHFKNIHFLNDKWHVDTEAFDISSILVDTIRTERKKNQMMNKLIK